MKLKLTTLLASSLVIAFTACEKNSGHESNPPKQLTKDEILVKQSWQVDEVWRNISGTNSHFVKNVLNTTGINYDAMRISFKTNGTGTFIDENKVSHSVNWEFTSADKRNMHVLIGPPASGAGDFTWNIVEISEESLTNTTAVGSSALVTARYVPVKDSVITTK